LGRCYESTALRGLAQASFCIGGIALFSLCTSHANASPWGREKNTLLVISRADYFKADLPDQTLADSGVTNSFERIESNTYAEFGLTHRLTIGGKAVYGSSWLTRGATAETAAEATVETAAGFSELELFVQQQITRSEKQTISLRSSVSLPSRFTSGARTELASDGVDVELSVLYGRNISTSPLKIFTATEVGFTKRIGASADQIKTQLTIGAEPTDRLLLLAELFSETSLQNEKNDGADFDIIKIQPSIVWRLTRKLRLQAGVTEEIAGRNVALGRTYFLGLWTEF